MALAAGKEDPARVSPAGRPFTVKPEHHNYRHASMQRYVIYEGDVQ